MAIPTDLRVILDDGQFFILAYVVRNVAEVWRKNLGYREDESCGGHSTARRLPAGAMGASDYSPLYFSQTAASPVMTGALPLYRRSQGFASVRVDTGLPTTPRHLTGASTFSGALLHAARP